MLEKVEGLIEKISKPMGFGINNNLVESACWADDIKFNGYTEMNQWHTSHTPFV